MPNRETHVIAGALAGGGSALVHQRVWLMPSDRFAFGAGAAVGGVIGGCLPDIFDPACSPNHRQWAHAPLPVGFFAIRTWTGMNQLIESLLDQAELEPDPLKRFALFFAAGFVKGVAPGYLSHLALDACTPCGLPLLGKLC